MSAPTRVPCAAHAVADEGFENAVSLGTRENVDDSLLPELIVDFTVVPEPAHAGMLLTGTLVLLGAGRLRNRRGARL